MQVVGQELINLIKDSRDSYKNSNEGIFINTPQGDFDSLHQITNDGIDLRINDIGYIMNTRYKFINTLSSDSFDDHFEETKLPLDGFILQPGEILYVGTLERISLKGSYIGRISGRSTYARLGLSISSSQDKFCGHNEAIVCLQLRNNSRQGLKIFPYQKLAQILIYKTTGSPGSDDSAYANESEYTFPQITENERYPYDKNTANKIAKLPSEKNNFVSYRFAKLRNTKGGVKLLNIIIGAIGTFGTGMVSLLDIIGFYKFLICFFILSIYLVISIILNLFIDNE